MKLKAKSSSSAFPHPEHIPVVVVSGGGLNESERPTSKKSQPKSDGEEEEKKTYKVIYKQQIKPNHRT